MSSLCLWCIVSNVSLYQLFVMRSGDSIPVSPATMTLNLPIALPLVVKGLLEGICILGMTSCGKLLCEPCCVIVSAPSSSPLDIMAWLADSSITDSSSDSFSDWRDMALGVLGIPDIGNVEGASVLSGVRGVELA
jgi:hypothetical protein